MVTFLLLTTVLGFSVTNGKDEVHRISINGQKDIVFLEGNNPCKVLKKYCKSIGPQIAYDDCFSQLHPLVILQLSAMWSRVYKKIEVEGSFFIDCQPITIQAVVNQSHSFDTERSDLWITSNNSSAEIHELLMLLERAMQRDTSALSTFNKKRYEYKLSDMDKLELYGKAIFMLPNNLFIVDQYGLALLNLERETQARKLWSNAVARGLWGNPLQRPVSRFVKGLTSKPWYDTKYYPFISLLEAGYTDIKAELLYNLENRLHLFTGEMENLHVGGEWTELRIKSSGYGYTEYSKYFQNTMRHIENCKQDFISIKFSAIQPGTHIRTHTGPTNEKLRLHLSLLHDGGAKIRVGRNWHTWKEGKAIMFDDSWEHEVLHTGQTIRVVLIMDIWHPELPEDKRIVH